MGTSKFVRFSGGFLPVIYLLVIFSWFVIFVSAVEELSIAAQPNVLQLSTGVPVEDSPGTKPGVIMVCERVHIRGLSRVHNLKKYAHSVTVKVKVVDSSSRARPRNIDVCFHRNISLGIGMCHQTQWEKPVKGFWVRSMSPYDNKLLDIRMPGPSFTTVEVSIEEEFLLYRMILLAVGVVLLMVAPALSKSIVFYYSSAMAVGVILVILMVLFQGMKLLPTGRTSSLAIFIYSSFIGLGSLFLRYLPGLLQSVLVQIGIGEDMYNPLAMVLLVCVILAGAWLGFWVVRKLVLSEDGSIDISTAVFVAWSIRVCSAAMIFQSSHDPLLAAEAFVSGVLISAILRRFTKLRFWRRLYKHSSRTAKDNHRRPQVYDSPTEDSHDEYLYNLQRSQESMLLRNRAKPFALSPCNSVEGFVRVLGFNFDQITILSVTFCIFPYDIPVLLAKNTSGLTKTPSSRQSDSGTYFSTFHNTPERKKFSKEEWESFTRDSTKKALEGLVSSPDFNKWAVANAERITLTPTKDQSGNYENRWRWLRWF